MYFLGRSPFWSCHHTAWSPMAPGVHRKKATFLSMQVSYKLISSYSPGLLTRVWITVDSLGLLGIWTPHVFAYAVPLSECHSTCCVLGPLQIFLHICFPLGETPTAGELVLAYLLTNVFAHSFITTSLEDIITGCSHTCSLFFLDTLTLKRDSGNICWIEWNGMEWNEMIF